MKNATLRTSTILIAVGSRLRTYASIEAVPPSLRRKLLETTAGPNAGTVLIADRKGREQILRAVRGIPKPSPGTKSEQVPIREMIGRWGLREWSAIILPPTAGLVAWLLVSY